MSDAEIYLRELRRALPIGYRRRLVAEVREHFASAADAGEPEQVTIERLGPVPALADQLLTDLRSGALGPTARLSAGLTTTRIIAAAALLMIAIAGAGAIVVGTHSSHSTTPTVKRMLDSPVVHNGVTVRRLVLTLQGNLQANGKRYWGTRPVGVVTVGKLPGPRLRIWYPRPVRLTRTRIRATQTR